MSDERIPTAEETLSLLALSLRASATAVDPSKVGGNNLSDEELERANLARDSYSAFVKQSWPVIEPGVPYVHGYHVDAIAEHLEACRRRQIKKLIINIPPRMSKSTLVAVMFCPWVWIGSPHEKFLYASYARDLAVRDSVQARFLIQSEWYQRNWGHIYGLSSDQNVKSEFRNTARGYRIATSVEAAVTGKGGNFVIVDDPLNAKDAASDVMIYNANLWWDQSMSTRRNNPKEDVLIVIMQRLHERDLTGHLVDQGYDTLIIPMEYEPTTRTTSIGWKDWRTKPGELMSEERFGADEARSMKLTLGKAGWAGQFQQRPSPEGGGKFESRWFKIVDSDDVPKKELRHMVRYWDLAATEPKPGEDPDYTVGLKLAATTSGKYYILDMVRFRGNPGDVERKVLETAELDGRQVPIRMEEEPGSSGKITTFHYTQLLKPLGYDYEGSTFTGNKEVRANPVSIRAQSGFDAFTEGYGEHTFHIVRGLWNHDLIHELEMFPYGAHDDTVDALSGAYATLVMSENRALDMLWSPEHHIVSWPSFSEIFGSKKIPLNWTLGRAIRWDISASKQPVYVQVAVPNEASPLAGKVFVTKLARFAQHATPREVTERIKFLERGDDAAMVRCSYINPEASSEIETFARSGIYFHPWDIDETRGIAQLRNYLELSKEAHPFNVDPQGFPLPKAPQLFFMVTSEQLANAKNDEGMLALRQEIPAYYLNEFERGIPKCGPALQALRALAAGFFPGSSPTTEYERAMMELEKKFPKLTGTQFQEALEAADEPRKATLLQAREMYFNAELSRAARKDEIGTVHRFMARNHRAA